jgi:hypothetical protein
MSDKLEHWIVIAGTAALATVFCLVLLAASAAQPDWSREDLHPRTASLTLWFGNDRH